MVAELISVGTELLLGNIVNTNSAYLSVKCAELGLDVYHQVTVGDNEERLFQVVHNALNRSDIVILTGGLGPTKDDLTKEVVARALNLPLVEDSNTSEHITTYFEKLGVDVIPENNWKQAIIIQGATVLDNKNGTAPGLIVEKEDKKVILLPGPPSEMIPMFEEYVVTFLKSLQTSILYSVTVKIAGLGESLVETMIEDLINSQSNPTIAPYAKAGEVHLRITASSDCVDTATNLIKPVVKELKKRFKRNIYSMNEKETLEEAVVKLLLKHELTISTAESLTGGLLSARLVNVAGVSDVFKEGFITYSDKAKRKNIDVSKSTLKKYGAVSEQCAREMVIGVANRTKSDVAIAVTGFAGPDGGSVELPVGTVFIGCSVKGHVVVKRFQFNGDRSKIREYTVVYALDLLRRTIQKMINN